MLDAHFLAFAGLAALLVLSPGATMVVVADAAIDGGRRAALWTVAGVGTANAALALACALGLSTLVHRVPVVLAGISIAGAAYLAWLGVSALRRAVNRPPSGRPAFEGRAGGFRRGLLTNFSNASVILFYAVVVPQFIAPPHRFLPMYLVLGGTHVAMSIVWQGIVGLSVGAFAEKMARPAVRRAMDLVMAAALLAFAVKIALA